MELSIPQIAFQIDVAILLATSDLVFYIAFPLHETQNEIILHYFAKYVRRFREKAKRGVGYEVSEHNRYTLRSNREWVIIDSPKRLKRVVVGDNPLRRDQFGG